MNDVTHFVFEADDEDGIVMMAEVGFMDFTHPGFVITVNHEKYPLIYHLYGEFTPLDRAVVRAMAITYMNTMLGANGNMFKLPSEQDNE